MGRRLWSIQLQYVLSVIAKSYQLHISYLTLSYYFIYFIITKTIYTTVDLNIHSEKDMTVISLYYNQPH